jgi:hypothetical protein
VTACGAPRTIARFDRATNHLCSADSQHRHFLKLCVQKSGPLQEPAHIWGAAYSTTLEHAYLVCSSPEKLAALRRARQTLAHPDKRHPKGFNLFRFASSSEEMAQSLAKGVADGGGVLDRQFGPRVRAIFRPSFRS